MNSFLAVFTILISIAPLFTRQQGALSERADVFREIPEEQRDPLRQAVAKLVEAEKVNDWKSVYSMLDDPSTQSEDKFITKMEQGGLLREFRPSKITFVPANGFWNIQGCASFGGDEDGEGHVASVHAHWHDSRWHLSPIAIDLFGTEKKLTPRRCSLA